MGTWLMLSVPPAMMTSAMPLRIRCAPIAMASRPEAQNRLMVTPGTASGSPARWQVMRAMFIPCDASGIAQPRMTSSACSTGNWGTRASAPLMARAARSSGRTVRIFPLGALPTGVRAAATIKASFIFFSMYSISVPQRFAGRERVLDAFERFGLAAEAQENLAFQVHDVLLGHKVERSQVAAAQNIRELRADLLIVLADLAGHPHLMELQLAQRQAALADG